MSSSHLDDLQGEQDDPRPPNLRARQKAETRRRLLDAAVEVFIEVGPANATLDAVAGRAGVSRPSLFFHFGSRLELMDQVIAHVYERLFESRAESFRGADLRSFMKAILRVNRLPEVRVLWQLGDLLQLERPRGPNEAYWFAVNEIERHLADAGLDQTAAHGRALVVAPALLLVARRAAFDLATKAEERDFLDAACDLALGQVDS